MLPGVRIHSPKKNIDERGFFAELFRADWRGFAEKDSVAQVNISESNPGIVRAWHRHLRGQIDYIAAIRGKIKVCVYDGREGSKTKGQLDEFILDSESPQIVRVPGFYWHGTKCIGSTNSIVVYLVTKTYDYDNPDEERRKPDDPSIIDPRTGECYDWNR